MRTLDISYRRILQITWPVLVTQLSYTAMGIIDTVMVGRLGVTALGGVGLGNLLTWWVLSFFWGLLNGVNALVAQAVGAGKRKTAGSILWQGVYLALASGLLIAAFWPFVPMLFSLVGATAETQEIAGGYMRIRLLGGTGFGLLLVADNFYRGLGRTRVPMWAGVAQAVLNCGFNYVLIFGKLGFPALGTAGAALGTILAQLLVGAALLGTTVLAPSLSSEFSVRSGWRFDRRLLGSLLTLSLPIGGQVFMEMGGISIFSALVARLGDAQIAATNAVIQAWSLGYMTAFALSVGATTLVGQGVGAGQIAAARQAVRRVMRLGYLAMLVPGAIYLLLPQQLMALFVARSEVVLLLPFARPLFNIVVICLLLDLQFNVLAGALRGAGDTAFVMWVNIGSAWLLFVPATILATSRWGVVGAWGCFIIHLAAMVVVLELRFRGRRWEEARARFS